MSGGEYNYLYRYVDEFNNILQNFIGKETSKEVLELRVWLKSHLIEVSNAMKEMEWYDSGDSMSLSKIKDLRDKCTKVCDDEIKEIAYECAKRRGW